MLRSIIIYLSKASWAQQMITHWKIVRRLVTRFVAGETLDLAIAAVRELNANGMVATLDQLGENTLTLDAAEQATQDVLTILDTIQTSGIKSNVSVKLSQIGLVLDADRCKDNLIRILDRARLYSNFVRVDMEDSSLTGPTLQVYWSMRKLGYENLGIAIQAYLYRSEEDICHLMNEGGKVRLCKGAYHEPPQVAFPTKREVDHSYDNLTQLLIEGACNQGSPGLSPDGRTPPIPGLATHDDKRIDFARSFASQLGLARSALEFQMLYGIRRDLQEKLVQEGYPVRIYVPFGTHWYPYFMRRLAERPANLWFFLSNLVRK